MSKPKGIIIYEGPSMIDNENIVCIVNGFRKSKNSKTGHMLQSWIIRSDVHPSEARSNGSNSSVCGDCKHRKWGTCYVNMMHGPNGVYKAYKNGSYERLEKKHLKYLRKQHLRIGSYGDPVAIPFDIWNYILQFVGGYTGYTHQWNNCDNRFKDIVMASVDTIKEHDRAVENGWRTFRVMINNNESLGDEIICPASRNENTQCTKCMLCNGSGKRKNIAISVHGQNWKIKRFVRIMKLRDQKKKYTHLIT